NGIHHRLRPGIVFTVGKHADGRFALEIADNATGNQLIKNLTTIIYLTDGKLNFDLNYYNYEETICCLNIPRQTEEADEDISS
ncbi:MAG: hypothetical protein HQK57_12925, partial [Deltaproteobacteria bacterium]|nr:hypothetical protein [Deltaproteobacteria bacterium]